MTKDYSSPEVPKPSAERFIDEGLTLSDVISFAAPAYANGAPWRFPDWPPDLFLIVATVFSRTGAYLRGFEPRFTDRFWKFEVTPGANMPPLPFSKYLDHIARRWREEFPGIQSDPEFRPIIKWWNLLYRHRATPLGAVRQNPKLCDAMLRLLVVADETCAGLCMPPVIDAASNDSVPELSAASEPVEKPPVLRMAEVLLLYNRWSDGSKASLPASDDDDYGHSLCRDIHPSRGRVLPKTRTPKAGLTLRTFSHYLAYCPPSEVRVKYHPGADLLSDKQFKQHALNLVVIPWPDEILPSDFHPSSDQPSPGTHRSPYQFFDYEPQIQKVASARGRTVDQVVTRTRALVQEATRIGGSVDGIVFPETSLTAEEFDAIVDEVVRRDGLQLLVAGVRAKATKRRKGAKHAASRNEVRVVMNFEDAQYGARAEIRNDQPKHHRWYLDGGQILTYGLGAHLHGDEIWAESMDVGTRWLNFALLREWLSFTVLICEDLARQDPVFELVRSVGPSLVIALLMDGPQLKSRWSARYATALSDDPGSATLSLTSRGMVSLSRPLGASSDGRCVVGLWKDPKTGVVEIELPESAGGVLLNISAHRLVERTADGRTDQHAATGLTLAGLHPLKLKP